MALIRVLVLGAAGRMGREVVRAVSAQDDMAVVAAVDRRRIGEDAGVVAGVEPISVPIQVSLPEALAAKADVMVDFTLPDSVLKNVCTALEAGVPCVVGATGLTEAGLGKIAALCQRRGVPALVAPNFAIGAVLMMQFAAQAARYFDSAEIVEMHHEGKLDSPSGTALLTARMMAEAPGSKLAGRDSSDGRPSRGQAEGAIHVHSIRLPGLLAHQEVILGGLGQTLTIRHDSTSRESYLPGVLMAIRRVRSLRGLVVGLEKIL